MEAELQQKIQVYQQKQQELGTHVQTQQTLSSQHKENTQVLAELKMYPEAKVPIILNKVFKLIGPCLLQQDHDESLMTVQKRLGFISDELARCETVIKNKQNDADTLKNELVKMQTALQAQQ